MRFLLVIATLAAIATGFLGYWLLRSDSPSNSQLGTSLVSGAVIALVLFTAESLRDLRFKKSSERASALLEIRMHNDLRGLDFSGHDLQRVSFRGKDLRNVDLRAADLRSCDLSFADIRGANFTRTRLSHAKLLHADMRLAVFDYADLSRAWIEESDGRGASFYGALLEDSTMRKCNFETIPADKLRRLLVRSDLKPWISTDSTQGAVSDFRRANADFSDVRATSFDGSNFTRASFKFAQVTDLSSRDSMTPWTGLALQISYGVRGSFRMAKLDPASASWSEWTNATIDGCNLLQADFTGTALEDVNLTADQAKAANLDLAEKYLIDGTPAEPTSRSELRRLWIVAAIDLFPPLIIYGFWLSASAPVSKAETDPFFQVDAVFRAIFPWIQVLSLPVIIYLWIRMCRPGMVTVWPERKELQRHNAHHDPSRR